MNKVIEWLEDAVDAMEASGGEELSRAGECEVRNALARLYEIEDELRQG